MAGKFVVCLTHAKNDTDKATVRDACRAFWLEHVIAGVPPAADGKSNEWGYVACDGDILLGSVSRPSTSMMR